MRGAEVAPPTPVIDVPNKRVSQQPPLKNTQAPPPNADDHMVLFEGSRDHVLVVRKRMTMQRWLAGSDEADEAIDELFARYQLTPIFLVLGVMSAVALLVCLVHHIDDHRWYWLVVGCGIWLWMNMCSTRSPRLLMELLRSFDVCFHCGGLIVAMLCLSTGFGWDERAVSKQHISATR